MENKNKKVSSPRGSSKSTVKPKTVKRGNADIEEVNVAVVTQQINIQPTIEDSIITKSLKHVYEQYVNDSTPYKIYINGQLIYDSVKRTDKPVLFDEYFTLSGNKYVYKGVRFEKY